MAASGSTGASTPGSNSRFTSQTKTAEDLLSTQTVGLVALSDFRKRRVEAIEQKARDAEEALHRVTTNDRSIPVSDAASIANRKVKKRRTVGPSKLSFADDEEVILDASAHGCSQSSSLARHRVSKSHGLNSNIYLAPKALTKSAVSKEAQTRESLRKEFLQIQDAVKATEICIPFVFYDGTNIPGGVCKVKKGDYAWVFLDRSRKVGANSGVGEKSNCKREWARIGVDDLMMVRGSIIIPHHYDFYYFIINHTCGPNHRFIFDYSAKPPYAADVATPVSKPKSSDPSTRPQSAKGGVDFQPEGANDDPTFTKVVDRRWYERNKHIFPASVWQEFDPEKDYKKEVRRDAGGNAFFFS